MQLRLAALIVMATASSAVAFPSQYVRVWVK